MKTFIIATGVLTKEQEDAITEFFRVGLWGFWHWTPVFWIVQTNEDTTSAQEVRGFVQAIIQSEASKAHLKPYYPMMLPGLSPRPSGQPTARPSPPLPYLPQLHGTPNVMPYVNIFVIEIPSGIDWAGRGPPGMFDWLQKNLK